MADDSTSNNSETSRKKPKISESTDFVCFKIVNQNGEETFYKIKRKAKLGIVINTYCERHRLLPGTARFFFESNRLHHSVSPADLDMHDGDQIEVFTDVNGGG